MDLSDCEKESYVTSKQHCCRHTKSAVMRQRNPPKPVHHPVFTEWAICTLRRQLERERLRHRPPATRQFLESKSPRCAAVRSSVARQIFCVRCNSFLG